MANKKKTPAKQNKSKKSNAWFKPLRNSYIAINYKGALAYIVFIAYLIIPPVIFLKSMSSKVLAIILSLVFWVVGYQLMNAFAKSKSK